MSRSEYVGAIERAGKRKEASLENPNGFQYMDHIWEMVDEKDDLGVVICAGEETYPYIPVRAWWSHGKYDWQPDEADEHSQLVFEVPDEVTRRLQSEHASRLMKRYFGSKSGTQLEEPILSENTDENRRSFVEQPEFCQTQQEIKKDWPTLKSAIEMTARDPANYLGGQQLRVLSTAGEARALARVSLEGNFEIFLPDDTVTPIHALWSAAFRKEVGIA